MHIWPSKQLLKTSKIWNITPPKGLSGKDLEEWYKNERDYKHTMLGIFSKEKKVDNKSKRV
jgi:hypothetical protein